MKHSLLFSLQDLIQHFDHDLVLKMTVPRHGAFWHPKVVFQGYNFCFGVHELDV